MGENKPQKVSIRFFGDWEIRAVWSDENSKWYFSVLDIIGAIRKEASYEKCRNYWKYLKAKLKKENSQLVSATTQLKLTAKDGKKYMSDALDDKGIFYYLIYELNIQRSRCYEKAISYKNNYDSSGKLFMFCGNARLWE